MGVDELLRGRRRFRQDAEPGEGIEALIEGDLASGHHAAANAMGAIAAGDEVAGDLPGLACLAVAQDRLAGNALQGDIRDLEMDRSAIGEAGGDQVLHHLMLAVDRDGLAGEGLEVDAVTPARKADLDAGMAKPLALQAFAETRLLQEIDRALLQHTRPDAAFDIVPAAALQNDGIDACTMQQAGQEQTCRPGADDADLRALPHPDSSRWRSE